MNQYRKRSSVRQAFGLGLAMLILLALTACTAEETVPVQTQTTPEIPSEPPATFTPPPPTPNVQVQTVTPHATLVIPDTGTGLVEAGQEIFLEACSACHQPQGQGFEGVYPPLNGSGFVVMQDPDALIAVVVTGRGGMPTFHNILSPSEIAAVISYIRGAWDNQAGPVEIEQVERVWLETGLPLDEEEAEEE